MEIAKIMKQKNLLVFLVAAFALVAVASNVSAFGDITAVKVNGIDALGGVDFANFAGDRVMLTVTFTADDGVDPAVLNEVLAIDVRMKAWFTGERDNSAISDRIEVLENRVYVLNAYLDVPHDLGNDLNEPRTLNIVVESKQVEADSETISFTVQRESYNLEILSVTLQPEVTAGESVAIDVVLKNRGSQRADDTFLRVKIPELRIETQTYFGDLTPTDQSNPDRDDALERRTYLRLPVDVPAGLYTVVLEAFNDDSFATTEKRILVSGVSEEALVIPSQSSKTFSTGETAEYKLTIVNRGSAVSVYRVSVDAPANFNTEVSESLLVVPAGSSRTFSVFTDSAVRDDYSFTVKVASEEGVLVAQNTLAASVTDNGKSTSRVTGGANTTVLLTVVLAIVFIVLLVVLIVLLTRKPETKEEFGESYY